MTEDDKIPNIIKMSEIMKRYQEFAKIMKQNRELAESYNRIKTTLQETDKIKIESQFEKLGINKNELYSIPASDKTKIKSKDEIQNELNIELVQLQIEDLKGKKWETWKVFVAGSIVTILTSVLPIVLTVFLLSPNQKDTQENKFEFPKIYLVHDTIRQTIYDTIVLYKSPVDTIKRK